MSHSGSKLEVEDEEKRQQRIGNLLEQLNRSSLSESASPSFAPPTFDFGEQKTYAVDPPSELLARVQNFLSLLKTENDSLASRMQDNPSSVDIENIEEGTDQYIEMTLGLGVLETRPKHSRTNTYSEDKDLENASEEDSSSSSSTDSTSSESTESDSEDVSDSDSSSGSSMRIEVIASRPIKPLPRRAAQSGIDENSDLPCADR